MSQIWKSEAAPYWAYFGERLADLADIRPGECILDIGSGRGTSLLPAAQKTGPGGFVAGIDDWEANARGTHLEIRHRRLSNAAMVKMDARRMGFRENSFDLALSGFAYVFCCLADVYSLLKQGGRMLVSSWAWQEDSEWMGQLIADLMPPNLLDDIPDPVTDDVTGVPRVYHLDTEAGLRRVVRRAGFTDVEVMKETNEFTYRDEDEWWQVMSRSGWQDYIERLDCTGADATTRFKERAWEKLQHYKMTDGIHFTRTAWFARGRK